MGIDSDQLNQIPFPNGNKFGTGPIRTPRLKSRNL
jgi:hypothetical protein